jgi:hypothetical protein
MRRFASGLLDIQSLYVSVVRQHNMRICRYALHVESLSCQNFALMSSGDAGAEKTALFKWLRQKWSKWLANADKSIRMSLFNSRPCSPCLRSRGSSTLEHLLLLSLIAVLSIGALQFVSSAFPVYALNRTEIALRGGGTDTVNPGGGCDGDTCTPEYCDLHRSEPGCFYQFCINYPDSPECS